MSLLVLSFALTATATPFDAHGRLRVAQSGTHLEHADGTPFFVLADTCWTGPALSTADDWDDYLKDRVKKGFTAIQFNMASPWRCAPTDADGNASYSGQGASFKLNEAFYTRLDARIKAINDNGLLAMPVLCWAHRKGDAGIDLPEDDIITLVKYELNRYKDLHALWILAGDNSYKQAEAEKWKRIGRAVFRDRPMPLVTTHPTGVNFPWNAWSGEKWLTVLGYQSGHGDDDKTWLWLHHGPPAEFGRGKVFTKPVLNLEPPYEGHNGYQSRKPHTAESVRRAMYWSLLTTPTAGVTYGGHGVWSWHTRPGEQPTDHPGTGVALPWKEALDLPAARQMKHLKAFFSDIEWTKLRPMSERPVTEGDLKNKPAQHVAVSASDDGSLMVAYIPQGTMPQYKRGYAFPPKHYYFDPATGMKYEHAPALALHDWLEVWTK
jgi:hypothetical protein